MVSFDAAHRAVHYPQDRRFRIWVRPSILIGIAARFISNSNLDWKTTHGAGERQWLEVRYGHWSLAEGCAVKPFAAAAYTQR
jgi:hypothetical protein